MLWQLHCQTLCKKVCHGSSETTIIMGRPLSHQMWSYKEFSLLNGNKCRTWVKIWSPSPVMVMSPNELKNIEWDEKLQTNNKQTNKFSQNATTGIYNFVSMILEHLWGSQPFKIIVIVEWKFLFLLQSGDWLAKRNAFSLSFYIFLFSFAFF